MPFRQRPAVHALPVPDRHTYVNKSVADDQAPSTSSSPSTATPHADVDVVGAVVSIALLALAAGVAAAVAKLKGYRLQAAFRRGTRTRHTGSIDTCTRINQAAAVDTVPQPYTSATSITSITTSATSTTSATTSATERLLPTTESPLPTTRYGWIS